MSRVRAVVIVLAVLFVLYVGTYLALLDTTSRAGPWIGPKYKSDSRMARAVFAPLAWLDYKVRPDYWHARAVIMSF